MGLRVEERIVARGEEDDLVVHHLVLRGSNRAIGRHLGELVGARYGLRPPPPGDPLRARIQREWLRRHAPPLLERLRGLADALGTDLADEAFDAGCLGTPPAVPGGSAAFVPPRRAPSGHPLVSRAFDFAGPVVPPRPGEPPSAGRPYVLELHPDAGHPSLAVCAFDLLDAVLDGVNAEGLVVVAAADAGPAEGAAAERPGAVGLHELGVARLLLDSCATAREARETLLGSRLHDAAHSARWLVADRHGDAFVLEVSAGWARVHLVEAAGEPLSFASPPEEGRRTLWQGEYDAVERRLSARFFLGRAGRDAAEVRFQLH